MSVSPPQAEIRSAIRRLGGWPHDAAATILHVREAFSTNISSNADFVISRAQLMKIPTNALSVQFDVIRRTT
jgi:hypothetical protein